MQSRWFENVEGQFDIIVSNPPYIDEADEHLIQGDVRFEPRSALMSGENGLADLRHLIKCAPVHLKDNGYLLLDRGTFRLRQYYDHPPLQGASVPGGDPGGDRPSL